MPHTREHRYGEYSTHATKNVVTGMLIGGVIGAVTMLLFAPRSGEETRAEIRNKATELRDRTTETVKDTLSSAKSKASDLRDTITEKAEEFRERGKHIADEQLDRVAQAAEQGKKKVKEY